jgi:hypothetical protein
MSAEHDPAGELRARILETPIPIQKISAWLDGLDHASRVDAVRSLGRREQRRLYEAADSFLPVGLSDMVSPSTGALESVRHYGKNTLPAFRTFEKRFCRPPDADPEKPEALWGYNFQTMAWLTGPGYFLARDDSARREVLVDYHHVPPTGAATPPEGWPEIRSNEGIPSRFVYGFMIDTLRRVSEHVTIGSAARKGKDLGSWFILAREG